MKSTRWILIGTLLIASLAPIWGQNDPDTDITWALVDPMDRYANNITHMDMDIDSEGQLVVAYALESFYPPSLGVAVRDSSGNWTRRTMAPGDRGEYGTIKHLTASVETIRGVDRVGIVIVWDPEWNARLPAHKRVDQVWVYEGPVNGTWSKIERTGTKMVSELQRPVSDPSFAHPWVQWVTNNGSFNDDVLAVAWTSTEQDVEQPAGVKIRFYRRDELDNRRLEQYKQQNLPPFFNPEIFQVAQMPPNSSNTNVPLTGSSYGRPALTMDVNNRSFGIAVQNLNSDETHIVSGQVPSSRGATARMQEFTSMGLLQPCTHPAIAGGTAAGVTVACLGAANGDGFELRQFFMQFHNPGSEKFIATINPRCRSRADIGTVSSNAFVTAECAQGEGWPVWAFEGERDDPSRPPSGMPINDMPIPVATQPQVAVTPRSTDPRYWVYGWSTREFFPYGYGPPFKSVFLDE